MSTSDPASFRCDFDIAARGWDHDAWCGPFFPPDLPRDWRLAFYANHFRSVLVPGRQLLRAESADLARWYEDTHEQFRFFLEISVRLVARFRSPGAAGLLKWLAPLSDRIAGLLLLGFCRRCDQTLSPWRAALQGRFPVHTLRPPQPAMPLAGPAAAGLCPCWQQEPAVGRLGLVWHAPSDLPTLRRQIEAFMAHAAQAERATLCFAGVPPPLEGMEQARILVELLGG